MEKQGLSPKQLFVVKCNICVLSPWLLFDQLYKNKTQVSVGFWAVREISVTQISLETHTTT